MINYIQIITDLINIPEIDKQTIKSLITETKDIVNGDFSLPCFSFAKALRKSPVIIAQEIADGFSQACHNR